MTCPQCNGAGKVVFVPPVRETCPACNGSGSTIVLPDTRLSDTDAVSGGGAPITRRYVMLPNREERGQVYSDDDVIYLIAIRSKGPKNGEEVMSALGSIRELVEPVTNPRVIARQADECTANDHRRLVELGFDWHAANSIFVVASGADE